MTQVEVLDARRDASGGYKVDVTRGQRIGRVSSEWFSRPADERYLSLSELARAVGGRAERSRSRVGRERADSGRSQPRQAGEAVAVVAGRDKAGRADALEFWPARSLVGAPAAYLRQLPAALAGINLQYGLSQHRAEQVKTLETEDGRVELRAVTGSGLRPNLRP